MSAAGKAKTRGADDARLRAADAPASQFSNTVQGGRTA
jgi:hypothetical protein